MEPGKFSTIESLKIFLNNVDLMEENSDRKTMTFIKFANMAVELQLFSQERQNEFLQKAGSSVKKIFTAKNLSRLVKLWYKYRNEFRLRLMSTKKYGSFFLRMIKKIDNFVETIEKADEISSTMLKTSRSIWFLYRLVDEESKRLSIDEFIEKNIFPPNFSVINKILEPALIDRMKEGFRFLN